MPGACVHSLDSFHIDVPDLEEASTFFTAFGLNIERLDDRLHLRVFDQSHLWAQVTQGPRKRLREVRFGIFEQDHDAFAARIGDLRIAPPTGERDDALWCRTPDGLSLALVVATKTSPDAKSSFEHPPRVSLERGASARGGQRAIRPRRLAHVSLFTTDVERAVGFYESVLGLRLSDRSGNDVAFLHGVHGSDHHLIALARSCAPGLHHSSWDVGSIAEVGLGAMQMADAGYAAGWGVGRHVLGSNYFNYVRDPWGSYAEYSADMDYVPAGSDWQGGDHPGEDSFYQWGPPPPADFVTNYEA